MEDVFLAGLEVYLAKHDPIVKYTKPPRNVTGPKKHTRYVSQETRKLVWKRDGSRCSYVSPDGRRCEATSLLQFDHKIAWGQGGSSRDANNIRLLCSTHNSWFALKAYGDKYRARARS